MKRVDAILANPDFQKALKKTVHMEKDRIYCKHGLEHLLDVSRIAYILVLEKKLDIKKDVVYAAGLLHDIGKYKQYRDKIPHNIASALMAPSILSKAGYKSLEISVISEAIFNHRKLMDKDKNTLKYILYRADKWSRNCFVCPASNKCNWNSSKKTKNIKC